MSLSPLIAAPQLTAPTGTVAYVVPGCGLVWDYRDWRGHTFTDPRWGAAVKSDPSARDVLRNRLGFRSRAAALSWLARITDTQPTTDTSNTDTSTESEVA